MKMNKKWLAVSGWRLVVCGWWLVGAMALTAQAATITYNSDETITEALTLEEDTEISVGKGATVTYNAAISGNFKLTKTGLGTLVLGAANSFSSLDINAGVLTVGKAGALGSGAVTIAGSTSAACQLRFDTTLIQAAATFSNAITLSSDSVKGHPAIYFILPTATQSDIWTVTFTGGITANGDFYIADNAGGKSGSTSTGANWQGKTWVEFNCAINASGKTFGFGKGLSGYYGPAGDVYFKGAVTATQFYCIGYTPTKHGAGGDIYFTAASDIGTFKVAYNNIYLKTENALGDPLIDLFDGYSSARSRLYIDANQKAKSVTSDTTADVDTLWIYASETSTLTLDGAKVDNKTAYVKFNGALSLVVDAQDDDFVQTQSKSASLMTGTITVKRGTFKITGGAKFANASGIALEGGTLDIDNMGAGGLASVAALSVKSGATLNIATGNPTVFDQNMAITLVDGAKLNIPSGTILPASSLKFNDEAKGFGTYTKTEIPVLPDGVKICVGGDINWNGGADDNLTTSGGNWSKEGAENVVQDGSLNVTLTGGDGMDYRDGDWLYKITNDITPNTEAKVAPFVIKPAEEGATLHLDHGIYSDKKTQLILSGHITDLPRQNTSEDNRICYYPSSVIGGVENAIQPSGKQSNGVLPLVLTNATVDIPVRVVMENTTVGLMSSPNSTNEIRGLANVAGYTSYLYADTGSVLSFAGGLTAGGNLCSLYGTGEYVVNDTIYMELGLPLAEACTLSLNTTNSCGIYGNSKREGIVMSKGSLRTLSDNVLRDTLQISFGNSAKYIELNATTQTVGVLYTGGVNSGNTTPYLHGDYPALLRITGSLRTGANKSRVYPPYCNLRITGGLSIAFVGGGTNELCTLAGRAFESCGDLIVSSNKLELASGASWLNGTNFVANGYGTLKFGGDDQVNRSFAVLRLADNGKVEIPSGKTVAVSAAYLNGVEVPIGEYTGESTEAIGSRISGGGTLKVGKKGTTITLW